MSINSQAINVDVENDGGTTDNLGFTLMAYQSRMIEQASMNNKNWETLDKYLATKGTNFIDCGTWS